MESIPVIEVRDILTGVKSSIFLSSKSLSMAMYGLKKRSGDLKGRQAEITVYEYVNKDTKQKTTHLYLLKGRDEV